MLGLGLSVATKILNSYVPEMRPSINKPWTISKLRSAFPEIDSLMKVNTEHHRLQGDYDYLEHYEQSTAHTYKDSFFDSIRTTTDWTVSNLNKNRSLYGEERAKKMTARKCPNSWPEGPLT